MRHAKKASRACAGKVRHRSAADAKKALWATGRTTGDVTLVFYFCRHCGGYHVGHPPRSEQRQLRVQRISDLIERAMASTNRK